MGNVKGKPYYLRQLIYAVKYDYGYEYLDRTGALLNSILREDNGWTTGAASGKGTILHHIKDGIKLSLSQEQFAFSLSKPLEGEPLNKQESDSFATQISNISSIIFSEFRIAFQDIRRAGARAIYYIPFESHEEASDWLLESNIIHITKNKLFEGELFSPSFHLRWKGDLFTSALRLEIYETNAQIDFGEELLGIRASQQSSKQREIILEQRKIKHRMLVNPGFGVNVDFDFFIEDKEINRELMLELLGKSTDESEAALKRLFE